MSKTIKIILYIAILLFAYFIITTIYKSCNYEKSDMTTEQIEDLTIGDEEDDFFNDFDDIEEDPSIEINDTESTNSNTTNYESQEDDNEEINYQSLDDNLKEDNTPDDESNDTHTRKSTNEHQKLPTNQNVSKSSSSGKYLIVSGSFLVKQNASNLVVKLKRMGYQHAEVVMFDDSSYYTVVANRTNSRSTARDLVSSLKNKGVDSYMHTRQ